MLRLCCPWFPANLIIPTNQNDGSIQEDLGALVRGNPDRSEDDLTRLCEMLVRSYDPCIGCANHYYQGMKWSGRAPAFS